MTWIVLGAVGAAFVAVLLLTPALPARTPGRLVALARRWNLDLHASGAAGWDGPLFLRIELRQLRRLRRRWEADVRVRSADLPPGLAIRARRPTDLRAGLVVDQGRLDEAVRVDADDPADALSRLDAKARAAVLRAVQGGAELAGGEWRLAAETGGSDLEDLLKTLVAPARALAADGDVDTRLSLLARTDPVLEVRIACAARRVEGGGLGRWEAPRLAEVLREGVAANPPVAGASAALAALQAVRARTEAGRVSLATGDEGRLSLAPDHGGELAVHDHAGYPAARPAGRSLAGGAGDRAVLGVPPPRVAPMRSGGSLAAGSSRVSDPVEAECTSPRSTRSSSATS